MIPPLKSITYSHSALIYNLNRGGKTATYGRDCYGRLKSGAWGRRRVDGKIRLVTGEDVWQGYHPPMNLDGLDGFWHGATDLVGEMQPFYAIAPGEVMGAKPQTLAIAHDLPNGSHCLAIYRHVKSPYKKGMIVREGEQLGRLANIAGTHCHLEIHSLIDLWDYGRIDHDESRGFFMRYPGDDDNLRSQMSTSWLVSCGLSYPFYTYCALKLIEHWAS